MGDITKVFFGLIWFLAGIFIVSMTWSWSTTLASLIEDSFYLALYWIGYLSLMILTVIIPPFQLVLTGFRHEES